MTLRQYIIIMLIATVLCWASWAFVIFNVDPFESSHIGFIFFYISFLLALIGTISLLSFVVYRIIGSKDTPLYRYVQLSFRQGLTTSIGLITFLFLQGTSLLRVWNGIILGLLFVIIISFNISVRKATKTHGVIS